MRTAAKLFICLAFILPALTYGQTRYLILRASYHPGFLRIVMQGDAEVVRGSRVYQRKKGILVTFPDSDVNFITDKVTVAYRQIDSRTILFSPGEFRGLKVFNLNHPDRLVVDVYLTDRQRLVQPEVPALGEKAVRGRLKAVVIDPGHGGFDAGISGAGHMEKHVVLDIARTMTAMIRKGGTESRLTREIDIFMSMKDRIKKVNIEPPDIFVSLHIGGRREFVLYIPVLTAEAPDRVRPYLADQGQESYINDSLTLVNALEEALKGDYGDDMVIVKSLPYSMMTYIDAAAVMIECPAFDNADYSDEFIKGLADSIYKGIYIYEENRSN